ncbi:MAG: hypothetical protein QOF73_2490 [Thermomicrobiales bacterium]|nr:hypothetical protein [Thermomicrobiales bacterium]
MISQRAAVTEVGRRLIPRFGAAIWIFLVILLAALFVIRSRGEFAGMVSALRRADLRWLAVALVCQIAVETLIAQKFRILLRRLGYRVRRLTLMRSHLYRHVIATVVPFGGPAAIVGFARDVGAAGVRTNDALYATVLSSIASEIAFLLVLLPTVARLLFLRQASVFVLAGTSLLIVMLTATVVAVLLAHRPSFHGRLPRRVREPLAELRAHGFRPRELAGPIALALGVNLCGIVMLEATLRAVGQQPSLSTVVAARVLASMVMLLAPVFQGAGAVELTAAGVLTRGGVPLPAALAAAVLFRFAQFWLPLTVGVLTRVGGAGVAVPVRRWLTIAGAGIAFGAASVALAEFSARHELERHTGLGSLEVSDLLGVVAGAALIAAIFSVPRLLPPRQRSAMTVAGVRPDAFVHRQTRR